MGKYFEENGKTFYDNGFSNTYERAHDKNFDGPRFKYKRCPFCKKLVCQSNPAPWLNHIEKCAPDFYTYKQLLELRYKEVEDLNYVNIGHSRKNLNF